MFASEHITMEGENIEIIDVLVPEITEIPEVADSEDAGS